MNKYIVDSLSEKDLVELRSLECSVDDKYTVSQEVMDEMVDENGRAKIERLGYVVERGSGNSSEDMERDPIRPEKVNIIEWLRMFPGLISCKLRAYSRDAELVCPGPGLVFRALESVHPTRVRVVILGQDPYHTPGKANGLAFGYHPSYKEPIDSSLANIIEEVFAGIRPKAEFDRSLVGWAEQGVLLLNTRLTVIEGKPLSHAYDGGPDGLRIGWEQEIQKILRYLSSNQAQVSEENTDKNRVSDVVFVAWGAEARRLLDQAGVPREQRVETTHPCKFSHMNNTGSVPAFTGSECFQIVNGLLIESGQNPIYWKGDKK